ncbi:MAG TPA: LysR family transcriptional regulator [Candidatus Angelobacter sp.]|nr:LysR family transcriptional regulator [Candidatus Angelobacter sp.]
MYPGIDLRLQRFVVVVAEELNFSAAAARLHIAQPALSRAIRQLEDQIDLRLFIRNSRKVELTEAGREFVYEARKAIHYSERVSEVVRRRKRQAASKLVIGYPPQMDARFMLDLSKIQISGFKDLRIIVHGSFTAEILASIQKGKFDAGIVLVPQGYLEIAKLQKISLYRYPLVAALPKAHPLASKKSLTLADINGQTLVIPKIERNPALFEWFEKRCQSAGFLPNVREVLDPHEYGATVFHGEGIGLGIGLSTTCPIHGLPDCIAVRPFREPNLAIETAFVFGERFKSGPLKAFPAAVLKCWSKYRPNDAGLPLTA